MTMIVRRSGERVHVSDGNGGRWSTFVPADRDDARLRGFRALELLDEHELPPGKGFSAQVLGGGDQLTYVREGALIRRGPADRAGRQRASEFRRAGVRQGVVEKSFNPSAREAARVFRSGIKAVPGCLRPEGEQQRFSRADRRGVLKLVASADGRDGSLRIRGDVSLYSSLLDPGTHLFHELGGGRAAWLHVVDGRIRIGDERLEAGDGVGWDGEAALSFTAGEASEILLFDLPA